MDNENLKKILNSYGIETDILSPDSKNTIKISIPDWWEKILMSNEREKRVKIILQNWGVYKKVLPKVIKILKKYLHDVRIIVNNNRLSLLYIFDKKGDVILYSGGLPCVENDLQKNQLFEKIPRTLFEFYTNLHNGWASLVSGSLGPLAINDIFYLSDYEWGILDEIKFNEERLNDIIAVFHNGAGGYLCLDVNKNNIKNSAKCIVWWHDEKPDIGERFWRVMDEWIFVNFD